MDLLGFLYILKKNKMLVIKKRTEYFLYLDKHMIKLVSFNENNNFHMSNGIGIPDKKYYNQNKLYIR